MTFALLLIVATIVLNAVTTALLTALVLRHLLGPASSSTNGRTTAEVADDDLSDIVRSTSRRLAEERGSPDSAFLFEGHLTDFGRFVRRLEGPNR